MLLAGPASCAGADGIVSCSRARLQLAAILHTANHLFDTPLVEADYEILTSNK
jgi:hypothetical protein